MKGKTAEEDRVGVYLSQAEYEALCKSDESAIFAYECVTNENGERVWCKLLPGEYGSGASADGIFRYLRKDEATAAGSLGGYTKELFEYWVNDDDSNNNLGVFARCAVEKSMIELHRGNYCSGVRGVIDPFDPDNRYGLGKATAKTAEFDKIQSKVSLQTTSTLADSAMYGNLSGVMSTTDPDINLSGVQMELNDLFTNPLYSFNSVGPLGSIYMSRYREDEFFEVSPNKDKLLYDDANDEIKGFCDSVKLSQVTWLKHHPNTWGLSSNNWFADEIVSNMDNL